MAADRRPNTVRTVVLVGGFPEADGELYFGAFPPVDGLVPFPGWEPFEGPDAADLDQRQRAAFSAHVVAVPETVTHGTVRLTDPRRYEVPVVLVCPEFSPAEAREWIAEGELAATARVEFVDINSGHWPMVTRPVELAEILADVSDPCPPPVTPGDRPGGPETETRDDRRREPAWGHLRAHRR